MNRLTRLTALLLALMMILSTFAAADTRYQAGDMTLDQWGEIVTKAEDELFVIDEGDSGKEVTPELPEKPEQGPFYPYTDGTETDLIISETGVTCQMTASGVAVLKNSTPGQWQIKIGDAWIGVTGETGEALWVTAAMMNGMTTADFRKALEPKDEQTGAYTAFTQTATVEIVEAVPATFKLIARADENGGEDATPAEDSTTGGQLSLQAANPDLDKYYVVINYVFDATSTSGGMPAANPYTAEVSTNKLSFSATVKHPTVKGYAPANAVMKNNPDVEATEALPAGFVYSAENITITNVDLDGNVNIYVYYVPAENTFDVIYREELVEYTIDAAGNDVKYAKVSEKEYTGITEAPVKNSYGDKTVEQWFATLHTPEGFRPLLYDDEIAIAADGTTEVNVYYQRLYYLMAFDLGGGYGVNPIYTKHGAEIGEVGTPTRPGYEFMGWTLDPDATEYKDGQTFAEIPELMPIGNSQYYAVWKALPVAYTVVYWRENANDNNYSFWGSQKFDEQDDMLMAGSILNYDASIHAIPSSITTVTINGDTVNESNYFTFNEALTDKNVVVEGDGTTILNVYYYRRTYTVYFDANGTMTGACVITPHTHGDGTCTQDLICHVHGEDCVKTLTCQLEAGHVHSVEECGTTLVCTETVHTTHTRACYEGTEDNPTADPRGNEPSNPVEGQVHVGRNNNYQSYRKYVYTNGAWYRLSDYIDVQDGDILSPSCHQHDDACYTYDCGKVENHKHVDSCYTYTCPEADHVHTSACYRPCTKPTHSHNNACNDVNGNSNVLYVITAKYNQDINWPAFDGIAYWTGNSAYDNDGLTQSSKVVTLTHDYANANTMTMQAHTGTISYALNYMFESFDQTSGEDTYKRRSYSNLYYDRSERYSQIAHYNQETNWSYKVIDGFTRAQSGNASSSSNTYSELDADRIVFLYYKRNRWTLSFYNSSSDKIPQIFDEEVMFEQPLDGFEIDGHNINNYKPADNYYPAGLEPGAYHFDGWYTTPECYDGTEFDPETALMPNGDLNIYGKWSPYLYDVRVYTTQEAAEQARADVAATGTTNVEHIYQWVDLDEHVKHGKPVSSAYTYDNPDQYDPETKDFPKPTRPGYTFALWYYFAPDGTMQPFSFTATPITQDTFVFAVWDSDSIANYTIYYVLEDGQEGAVAEDYYLNEANWVTDPYVGRGLAGANVTERAKGGDQLYDGTDNATGNTDYREGYFPTSESHSFFLNVEDENTKNVWVFEYVPEDEMPYTVYYVTLEDPQNGLDTVTIDGVEYFQVAEPFTDPDNRKAVVTENYKPVSGNYVPDAFQKRLIITAGMDATDRVIVFYYDKDESRTTLEVNHWLVHADGSQNTPYDSEKRIVDLNPTFTETLQALTIPNYTYAASQTTRTDGENAPVKIDNLTITISQGSEGVIVDMYYVEDKVNITYVAVGPTDAENYGAVSPDAETNIGVVTGNPTGSTATAHENYHFEAWYRDAACTDFVTADTHVTPEKTDGVYTAATYYAKFVENEVTIKYLAVGPEGATDFGTVNPTGETVRVLTGTAVGSTATPNAPTFKFVGWYDNAACDGIALSTDVHYVPTKANGAWVDGTTYYAKFDWNVADLTITKEFSDLTDVPEQFRNMAFTVKVSLPVGTYDYTVTDANDVVTEGKLSVTNETGEVNGTAELLIKADQTIVIKGIQIGCKYSVEEQNPSYFNVNTSRPAGSVFEVNTDPVNLVNTYHHGSLSITKELTKVDGVEIPEGTKFPILVTLMSDTIDGTYNYTVGSETHEAEFKGGEATIMLAAGETATFAELPFGVDYMLSEPTLLTEYHLESISFKDGSGNPVSELKVGYATHATITNLHLRGNLEITKTVTGTNAPNDEFTFKVTLKDRESNTELTGTYKVLIGDVEREITNGGTITLRNGQTATIVGLPGARVYSYGNGGGDIYGGTTYTVEEVPVAGYVSSSNAASGLIIAAETATAAFTNDYTVGDLTITKKVEGKYAPANDEFEITVNLTAAEGAVLADSYMVNGESKSVTSLSEDKKSATLALTLKADETVKIENIQTGTGYSVVENEVHYTPSYSSHAQGTIVKGETAVTVTNTYRYSTLTINKVGMEDGESAIFQVEAESRYNPGKTTTFTVSVPNEGFVTIRDLLIDSDYTIREIGTWSNRYDQAEPVNGKISKDGSIVTITNTDKNNQWLHDEDYVHNDFSKPGNYPNN